MIASGENTPTPEEFINENPKRCAAALKMIHQAVNNGWDLPETWFDALPKIAAQIAADDSRSSRERLRALELLRKLARDNIDTAVKLIAADQVATGLDQRDVEQAFSERPTDEALDRWKRRHAGDA